MQSAVFSGDGRRILTASRDKTARLWKAFADTQALVERGHAATARCLTQAERQSFYLAPTPPRLCGSMRKWPYNAVGSPGEGARLLEAGKGHEAKIIFDVVLTHDPSTAPRIADMYITRGSKLLADRKATEAEAAFAEARARDPTAGPRIDAARARATQAPAKK